MSYGKGDADSIASIISEAEDILDDDRSTSLYGFGNRSQRSQSHSVGDDKEDGDDYSYSFDYEDEEDGTFVDTYTRTNMLHVAHDTGSGPEKQQMNKSNSYLKPILRFGKTSIAAVTESPMKYGAPKKNVGVGQQSEYEDGYDYQKRNENMAPVSVSAYSVVRTLTGLSARKELVLEEIGNEVVKLRNQQRGVLRVRLQVAKEKKERAQSEAGI